MISYDEDYTASALRESLNISTRVTCPSTWFGCPPDPTIVVLSAIWYRVRTWDIALELLAARLCSHHQLFTEARLVSLNVPARF